jgi:hypothetical protein
VIAITAVRKCGFTLAHHRLEQRVVCGLRPLAVASVIAAVSVATAAEPSEGALVESVSGSSRDVQAMDYVRVGQIIRLGLYGTIVLSYKASCVREMITGGIVTVGTEHSYVRSGRSEGSAVSAIRAEWCSQAKVR